MVEHKLQKAHLLHRKGELGDAEAIYAEVLSVNPKNLSALLLMGLLHEQQGNVEKALYFLSSAYELAPVNVDVAISYTNLLNQNNQFDKTLEILKVLDLNKPDQFEVLFLLASTYQQVQQLDKAVSYYKKAKVIDNSVPELYYELGRIFKIQSNVDEARKCLEEAVDLAPDYAEAYGVLATLYFQTNQLEKAVDAFQKALDLLEVEAPEVRSQLYGGLAQTHVQLKNIDQAVVIYEKARESCPDFFEFYEPLASSYLAQGRVDEALAIYEQLSENNPNNTAHLINQLHALPVIYQDKSEIQKHRKRYESLLKKLLKKEVLNVENLSNITGTNFYIGYQNMPELENQLLYGQVFNKILNTENINQPKRVARNKKPRVGFYSRHLYKGHTIGKLMQGVVQHLNRSVFEPVIITLDSQESKLRQELAGMNNPALVTVPDDDLKLATQKIQQAELDVLYFCDVGMEPMAYYLARNKLAPVQCVTYGHPVTTGLPTMDYFISSHLIEPEDGDEHYSETLVKLDTLPFYYSRPGFENVVVGRQDLGLPEDKNLYVCPQSIFKFHPDFDEVLIKILQNDPNGQIVLLSHVSQYANNLLLKRIESKAPDVINRVMFCPRMPRAHLMSLMATADVMLDPFYFVGGNTSYEALAFGTPIITMPGAFMRGRLTYGFYQKMGMDDCIAYKVDDYVALCLKYGQDKAAQQQVRQKILSRCGVLYSDMAAVRETEAWLVDTLSKL